LNLQINTIVSVGDLLSFAFGLAGLLGLFLAYWQLRLSQRSTRAKFVLDLHQWFSDDWGEREFFYRLDYTASESAFRFDPDGFPHSPEENHLDSLLRKLLSCTEAS